MTRSLHIRLLIACAFGTGSFFVAPAVRAGDEVGVPKDAPAFKVTLPDGWEAKDAITGISPQLDSRKGLVVDFKKLSATDEKTAMARAEADAKDRVAYDKDIKTDEPMAASPEQVAGNKAFQIRVSSVNMPPDRYMYQVVAFTVDGKTYYSATFHGDEKIVKANSEDIAAVLASIAPAK